MFEGSYGLTTIVLHYVLALAGVELVRRAYLKFTKYRYVKMPKEEKAKKLTLEMYLIALGVLLVIYVLVN